MDNSGGPQIDHVFVLMLENRSFDHMLAFSGIAGIDRATSKDSNSYNGHDYSIGAPGAPWTMPTDPGHEFADVVQQLFGAGVIHQPWTPFPSPGSAVNSESAANSGFVASYATSRTETGPGSPSPPKPADIGEIMRCFDTPHQLPVLHQLATEFAVCDQWFSSIPGPTWPNRLFVHGASSAGWADSPSPDQLKAWYQKTVKFVFPCGASIFDRLTAAGLSWRVYVDEDGPPLGGVPLVAALDGVTYQQDTFPFAQFDVDLSGSYGHAYTFIEPNYGDVLSGSFAGGSSQHPMDGVTRGESLIKSTYESIRRSTVWETSVLIVLYDEHGGFYDSVHPGEARPPDDGSLRDSTINSGGFLFDNYGVRVPAIVISPLIQKATVDTTVYDHASVPATVERIFGLLPMTQRDTHANDIRHLFHSTPRTDCPMTLVAPADAPAEVPVGVPVGVSPVSASGSSPDAVVDHGAAHVRLSVLLGNELAACENDDERAEARHAHAEIRTHADAQQYVDAIKARADRGRRFGE